MVVVVTQPGCPACEEFTPLVAPVAASFARAGVPTYHLNAATPDPAAQAWMDQHGVQATPTVYIIHQSGAVWKMEGAQPEDIVRQIYDFAYSQSLR